MVETFVELAGSEGGAEGEGVVAVRRKDTRGEGRCLAFVDRDKKVIAPVIKCCATSGVESLHRPISNLAHRILSFYFTQLCCSIFLNYYKIENEVFLRHAVRHSAVFLGETLWEFSQCLVVISAIHLGCLRTNDSFPRPRFDHLNVIIISANQSSNCTNHNSPPYLKSLCGSGCANIPV